LSRFPRIGYPGPTISDPQTRADAPGDGSNPNARPRCRCGSGRPPRAPLGREGVGDAAKGARPAASDAGKRAADPARAATTPALTTTLEGCLRPLAGDGQARILLACLGRRLGLLEADRRGVSVQGLPPLDGGREPDLGSPRALDLRGDADV